MLTNEDSITIVEAVSKKIPSVIAIYLYGSHATGDANEESDIDLAVLSDTPLSRYELVSAESEIFLNTQNNGVDFVDLRRCPLTLAMEVLNSSILLMDKNPVLRGRHEMILMSLYADLNYDRKEILEDIQKRGSVYGR